MILEYRYREILVRTNYKPIFYNYTKKNQNTHETYWKSQYSNKNKEVVHTPNNV